jgi:hypothetical protein
MHSFFKIVDSFGWPMMQYKLLPIDLMWILKYDLAIQWWKFGDHGCPKLPNGVSKFIPFCLI